MTTLTHDGKTYKLDDSHPDFEQFLEKEREISLGLIPPEPSKPYMDMFKLVTMGKIPLEQQEKFEDVWSGKYFMDM